MRKPYQPTLNEIKLSSVLHALSDPHRLQIVKFLKQQAEHSCSVIQIGIDIPKSTLTHHLKVLRESGITQLRMDGTQHFYSLRMEDLENLFPGLVTSILRVRPELLE
jgi:DNA-binding transcriptional ArsR family regulator